MKLWIKRLLKWLVITVLITVVVLNEIWQIFAVAAMDSYLSGLAVSVKVSMLPDKDTGTRPARLRDAYPPGHVDEYLVSHIPGFEGEEVYRPYYFPRIAYVYPIATDDVVFSTRSTVRLPLTLSWRWLVVRRNGTVDAMKVPPAPTNVPWERIVAEGTDRRSRKRGAPTKPSD